METLVMKKTVLNAHLLVLGATAFTTSGAADLAEMTALAKASGCYSCHANAEKIVGPAFSSVAEKYAGQKDAASELAMSIQNGSVSKWGRVPMPAHRSLPVTDVKKLAEWVLTMKP
jgi:cytochrome c